MNEATLDRWITMRMLTEEVGELDLDGFRITVIDKANPDGKTFRFDIRITRLSVSAAEQRAHHEALHGMAFEYDPSKGWMRGNATAKEFADAINGYEAAPKRKAAKPKGKAK